MATFEDRILALFATLHPLGRIERAGYVLRGVAHPETVAAHSHFVSLLTLFFVEEYPDEFDASKAMAMALIHDLAEVKLMDIPMPYADAYLAEAKDRAEQAIFEDLFDGFPEKLAVYHQELIDRSSPEARLVRGLDKAQMMLKVISYEAEHNGRLTEFWLNPKNFQDYGCEAVSLLFDAICNAVGRPRPR
ncbi:MAG TPA: HD domain-containing protein [Candidatus Hydrogenedentes bacterium]|nr:HD domain-containing protein [Candidatus Hydrogenedentota bacterium]